MALEAKLTEIQGRLTPEHFPGEAAVSQGIVLPILRELNWDTDNPMVVRPEYTAGRGRVDFALCERSGSPKVFIEVKKIGGDLEDGFDKLMLYAQSADVHIVVLTDGRTWSFYLPDEAGKNKEKQVSKIDLSQPFLRASSEVLLRYLEKSRVVSGEALKTANVIFFLEKFRKNQPDKWKWVVDEAIAQFEGALNNFKREIKSKFAQDNIDPDTYVVDYFHSLLREKFSQSPSDTTASRLQSEAGVQDSVLLSSGASKRNRLGHRRAKQGSASLSPKGSKGKKRRGGRSGELVILGRSYSYSSQSEAMALVFEKLQEADPGFLQRFYEHVRNRRGSGRRYLGRNQRELFGDNVKTHRSCEQIGRDWIISTNYKRQDKEDIIQLAAKVAGLTFGKDIIVKFGD